MQEINGQSIEFSPFAELPHADAAARLEERLQDVEAFSRVGECADGLGRQAYAVGGIVRDILLNRPSSDIDFVTVGSGIELAKAVARSYGRKHVELSVFASYGTAQVKRPGLELEFVGARRESYNRDSRNPVVEDGTLEDDLSRRDFTVNALAVCLNRQAYGRVVDMFGGLQDLDAGILRTPLDPDVTFSDDPLRMMRAVRFATQLGFVIAPETFDAIKRNAPRIAIIKRERIMTELMKIMASPRPSTGWLLLDRCGLLELIFPELSALKGVETLDGRGHKDNFLHTLQVLDNVAAVSDNIWLRWGALLHDIGKPVTKRYDKALGWTFHNHDYVGSKMLKRIFRTMRFPLNDKLKYVAKLVELHMRPIVLVDDIVTDSAVRRLINDAGDDLEDLMTLCRADITSKNPARVRVRLANFDHLCDKMADLEARDHIRNYQPPVDGIEIMKTFGLGEEARVGRIKSAIKEAILEGKVANEYEAARRYMLEYAETELGLTPV